MIPRWAHYRDAELGAASCGTCDFYENGLCAMFEDTPVGSGMTCDRWRGRVDKEGQLTGGSPNYFESSDVKGMAELVNSLEPKLHKADGSVLLISHAKTRHNRPGEAGDIVGGWLNTRLDSGGLKQARELGELLKGVGIDELHTSDLARARQTAEIVGRQTGHTPVVSRDYRPWNLGNFAGHSSSDVIPKLKPYMGADSAKPVDGGESFDDFQNRFIPAFEALLAKAEQGGTVALVTHSRNIALAQGWLKGRNPRSQVDTSAISKDKINPAMVLHVTRDRRSGRWLPEKAIDLTVRKGQANPATLNLRVHGVSTTPSGHRVYRMVTRDGQYIGRTNATRLRARKGDVLKVQASDLLQDAMGDMRWTNPNVISQYRDAPHSWRELTALAGGELEKDGPPADASEIPAAGDEGDNHVPSGPTLDAVHVPSPLPNISLGYQLTRRVGRKRENVLRGEFLPVSKAMAMKQLVYGVVLEPNSLDAQNDYMLPKHVEATAHGYLKRAIRGSSSVHKLAHRGKVNVRGKGRSLIPVESFIAPVDFSYDGKEMIKAGSWVLVVHVEDPELWQDFLDGKYQAFSVGGTGVRQSLTRPEPEVPRGWITSDANDWRPNPSDLGLSSFI